MRNVPTFRTWLEDLQHIIDSPSPRSTLRPLRTNYTILGNILLNQSISHTEIEELLSTLLKLRQSQCNGRCDHEQETLRRLSYYFLELAPASSPSGKHETANTKDNPHPDQSSSTEDHLKNCHLLINHINQLLRAKPPKLKRYKDLIEEAYRSLVDFTQIQELEIPLQQCLELTREHIRSNSPLFVHSSIEFIESYYLSYKSKQSIPEDLIEELETASMNTKDRSTLYEINKFFVNIGYIDEFSAIMSMEDFNENI